MPQVKLSINRIDTPNYYIVSVIGEGFVTAANKTAGVRLKGADTWFDDRITANFAGGTVGRDGFFAATAYCSGEQLDEDWGEDEIYAIANVPGYGDVRSNTITRHF
jgi:hypothetical protein